MAGVPSHHWAGSGLESCTASCKSRKMGNDDLATSDERTRQRDRKTEGEGGESNGSERTCQQCSPCDRYGGSGPRVALREVLILCLRLAHRPRGGRVGLCHCCNIHQLVATNISVPSDALSIKQVEAYGAQLESHLQEVHQLLQSKSTTSSQVRDRVISLETESLPAFAL
eukprot:COSAG05_NODE_112_length_18489_cov_15.556281_12_plen_170_part_00